jgi:S-DNA-T family DNA segregation ATPase FtsK/SpoIIIE
VPFDDGIDMVTPVVNRAMAGIGELRRTGRARDEIEGPVDEVDHLADIAEVLGSERQARTQVVLTRLAELNSDHYEGWGFADLKAALAEYGIKPGKSDGVMVIRAASVERALAERDD